jgi:hypothetical protein
MAQQDQRGIEPKQLSQTLPPTTPINTEGTIVTKTKEPTVLPDKNDPKKPGEKTPNVEDSKEIELDKAAKAKRTKIPQKGYDPNTELQIWAKKCLGMSSSSSTKHRTRALTYLSTLEIPTDIAEGELLPYATELWAHLSNFQPDKGKRLTNFWPKSGKSSPYWDRIRIERETSIEGKGYDPSDFLVLSHHISRGTINLDQAVAQEAMADNLRHTGSLIQKLLNHLKNEADLVSTPLKVNAWKFWSKVIGSNPTIQKESSTKIKAENHYRNYGGSLRSFKTTQKTLCIKGEVQKEKFLSFYFRDTFLKKLSGVGREDIRDLDLPLHYLQSLQVDRFEKVERDWLAKFGCPEDVLDIKRWILKTAPKILPTPTKRVSEQKTPQTPSRGGNSKDQSPSKKEEKTPLKSSGKSKPKSPSTEKGSSGACEGRESPATLLDPRSAFSIRNRIAEDHFQFENPEIRRWVFDSMDDLEMVVDRFKTVGDFERFRNSLKLVLPTIQNLHQMRSRTREPSSPPHFVPPRWAQQATQHQPFQSPHFATPSIGEKRKLGQGEWRDQSPGGWNATPVHFQETSGGLGGGDQRWDSQPDEKGFYPNSGERKFSSSSYASPRRRGEAFAHSPRKGWGRNAPRQPFRPPTRDERIHFLRQYFPKEESLSVTLESHRTREIDDILEALEDGGTKFTASNHEGYVVIELSQKLGGGMDTRMDTPRLKSTLSELRRLADSSEEEGEEKSDIEEALPSPTSRKQSNEDLFRELTEDLLGSNSKVSSLLDYEQEEVRDHLANVYDVVWSEIGNLEALAKHLLWEYAELYVQYIEQRGTAQANSTKLEQSRKQTVEAVSLAKKLNLKNTAVLSNLKRKLKDFETSQSRNQTTTSSGRPRTTHESKSRDSDTRDSKENPIYLQEDDDLETESNKRPPTKKVRADDRTDQRTVFYTVKGYERSESEQASKSKAESGRLSRFKPRKMKKLGSANQQMIAYVMDYSDYVKRFDPEREEAWTELGMALSKEDSSSDLRKLLRAIDKMGRDEISDQSWDKRIATLLQKAIPVDLTNALKAEAENLNFSASFEYREQVNNINNLLSNMGQKQIEDATLVRWLENALSYSNEPSHANLLEKWNTYSMDSDHSEPFSFDQAIEKICSYELALEKGSILMQRNKGRKPTAETNPKPGQKPGQGWSEAELQKKFGTLCENDGCRHRDKTEVKKAEHLKKCKFAQKKVQFNVSSNLTGVEPQGGDSGPNLNTVKVLSYLGRVESSLDSDYVPRLTIEIKPGPDEEKGLAISAFCDSGCGVTLISDWLEEKILELFPLLKVSKGVKYLVKGVDSSGKGVECSRTLLLYLKIGSKLIEITALVVPGLPERIVLGRNLTRKTNIILKFGSRPEENRIVSATCDLDQKMITAKEYQKMEHEEMSAAAEEVAVQSSPMPIEAFRTFVSASKEEVEEIFVTGPLPAL